MSKRPRPGTYEGNATPPFPAGREALGALLTKAELKLPALR